jgi:UDP-hydrolysing UDP-N-acetyl-D-glucosamine 2-epimerase
VTNLSKNIKKIGVVTGSRAEFGIMHWVISDIIADPELELLLIVTGSHLSSNHGNTVSEIEQANIPISARIPLDLTDDTAEGIAAAMGQCQNGMVRVLRELQPDILLVLGDRYEIFSAVQAAMLVRLPVAHIAGGDVTEGAIDDAMRHAITKMAHLHFATNEVSARRIVQMGEDPNRVFNTGSPALDQLRRAPLLNRAQLESALGAPLGNRNVMVAFHPVTLAEDSGLGELENLLAELANFDEASQIWITRANADAGGKRINARIDQWATTQHNAHIYTSLGMPRFMGLLAQSEMIIGNSSSGLYEAPSFGTPTVNIGRRQMGRLTGNSVFNCEGTREGIRYAINAALDFDRSTAINPYGDGNSAQRIVAALKNSPSRQEMLAKRFFIVGNPV